MSKTAWIVIGVIAAIGIVAGFYFYGKKQKPVGSANGGGTLPGVALDAADDSTVQKMLATFKSNPIGGDAGYILSTYQSYMKGGANEITSDYGMVNGTIPKSSAFLAAVWNGWLPNFTSNATATPATPAAGKSQSDATAAANLAISLAHMYEAYKTTKLAGTLQ